MLPGVFGELSGTVVRFSGVLVYFWGSQPLFSGGAEIRLLVGTGARNIGAWRTFDENHDVLRTRNMDEGPQRRLWRNGKEKAFGKLKGASWEVYRCF